MLKSKMFKRLLTACFGLFLLAGMSLALTLNGAGATFPYPIYSKWIYEYNKETGVQINYQSIGSGGGISQFTAGTVDFGASDAPMTNSEIAKVGGNVLHVPTVMGAVAISYNLPGVSELKLDADVLADIFLGKIKKWNDATIVALNPGVKLPEDDILVAHRSDGSGTTSIFSSYLAKVSSDWASQVGAGKALSWPAGVGGKGNEGVTGIIKVNKGAIGYIELSYAMSNNLPVIALKNRAGKFVKPTIASTSSAAAGAMKKMPADFRVDITNAAGVNSYPISGLTWILVQKQQRNAEKGKVLVDFLTWSLTTGQKFAEPLLYAPLPDSLQAKVLAAVKSVNY
ncbi:phosphate ABC transporter substrate-binding protein PstS [Candidatus Saganbacteria bacterium]|nr:phosphate ABC transporter substrate-binding protein PstS [Candidatus Saganbacteria bacterium]